MTSRIRVLHVITTFSMGGAERHLLELVRELPRDRFSVQVAFFKEEAQEARSLVPDFTALGIDVVDLGSRASLDPRPALNLARLIRRTRPDIVHTHLYRADVLGVILARIFRTPAVVSTVHNMDLFTNYRAISRWVGIAYRRADRVIAISDAVRRLVVASLKLDRTKVITIHYGITTPGPSARSEPRGDPKVIGTIGRLARQKGYDVLLEALAILKKDLPDARLLVAGHDDEGIRDLLKDQATRLGLTDDVDFLGYVDDSARFLSGLDVFVLASRWEGFGLVLLEAMAEGLPVVATDVGPIPEVVVHEETGLLVPPGDAEQLAAALRSVLLDPALGRRFGEAGRARLTTEFTTQRMADKTAALYEHLRVSRA